MDNGLDLIEALNQISREKGIDKEIIYEAIETSLVSACKKNFGTSQNINVSIDRVSGQIQVFAQKEVAEEVEDENLQISLEDARKTDAGIQPGDFVNVAVTPRNFGRISAQTAKQVVMQKFREAEREILFNEYITKQRDAITGIVQRKEHRNVFVALGRLDAVMAPAEQVPGEDYVFGERLKVYILEVKQSSKGPMVYVSRTHPELIKRLFEQEVPEVYSGVVEIKALAREAGSRTKMAVYSRNKDVDPVGACVGQNGSRVNIVVDELKGEKIDIINWDPNPVKFIASALSPSKVLAVLEGEDAQGVKVVVPDNQLSLAIGKDGQNARLAARLTGWRIDIKSESQASAMGLDITQDARLESLLASEFEGGYDENYDGEYDESYEGEYDANYDGEYDESYEGEYDANYDGEYDESYDENYDENYDGEYDESYDGEYDESYDGEYDEEQPTDEE